MFIRCTYSYGEILIQLKTFIVVKAHGLRNNMFNDFNMVCWNTIKVIVVVRGI